MRILFVHNSLTSFVRFDLESLREHFQVTECPIVSRFFNPIALWRKVREHDLVFGWFASWHTVLPVLMARLQFKPSILVVGGYDLANMPQIRYGHQRRGIRRYVTRFTMAIASRLVTNSHYSAAEAINAGVAASKLEVIYHGLEDDFGQPFHHARGRTVLTVGNVNYSNIERKGLRLFVEAASFVPDAHFTVVGAWQDRTIHQLQAIAPANVHFTGRLSDEDLHAHYRKAAVYVQGSQHEGFGLSLAEAMLAGCVPVATQAGAIPEVVGDCAYFCESRAPESLGRAIRLALEAPEHERLRARKRILDEFPAEKRREELERLISNVHPCKQTHTEE
jgi:glycosyltransferase involved in cell wall biosynthesis